MAHTSVSVHTSALIMMRPSDASVVDAEPIPNRPWRGLLRDLVTCVVVCVCVQVIDRLHSDERL